MFFVLVWFFPFLSEENVYLLCKKLCTSGVADADGSDLYVVFISNEKKQVCNCIFSIQLAVVFH